MATKWRNWSGIVECEPRMVKTPSSEEEVVKIVQSAVNGGRKIRVVGSGHSFSNLVETNDILLSLDKLQGVIDVDKERCEATVWAGTKIKDLGRLLFEEGLAMENLGDIDVQSIAGATATGTHGTGITFGNISTQITEITLVNGLGELITTSATENPQFFKATQISLGALGVITRLRLRLVPSYNLEIKLEKSNFDETLAKLAHYNEENRNFEFYNFPYSDVVQLRLTNLTDLPARKEGFVRFFNDIIVENGVFLVLCELNKAFPSLTKRVSRMVAAGSVVDTKINHSHRIFASVRSVRFNEMEYNVPLDCYKEVVKAMRKRFDERQYQVHFPVENRFVQEDDIWLSPAYQRKSAYIAIHSYKGMPYEAYFKEMEEIFRANGGRPHWGKMHYLSANELADLYPKWEDFQAVRKQLDPVGVFLSPYMRTLFDLG